MDFAYSDDQRALRDQIVRFAQAELNQDVVERDRRAEFHRDLWEKCAAMGILGLPVPEAYGGMGMDALTTATSLEALGYGCRDGGLVFSICAHILACVVPIWKHASEEQKQHYLPKLCDGSMIAVNAMTEPATGSDAFAMSSRAVSVDGGFKITGTKTFSSNGPVADLALVYALTDAEKGFHGGVSAFLVEKGVEGFTVGQTFEKMGLRTSSIGELIFDDVGVPDSAMVGGEGGGGIIFAESMTWERVCLVAAHVGTMQRLLEQVIEYARTRKQFGQSIGKFQAVSHKIVDIKVRLEAARLLTYRSAWLLDQGMDANMDASITKLFASEALVKTALETVQVFGGYGFMVEYEVERALRDSIASTVYSGTSEMQREIIARWLGL